MRIENKKKVKKKRNFIVSTFTVKPTLQDYFSCEYYV